MQCFLYAGCQAIKYIIYADLISYNGWTKKFNGTDNSEHLVKAWHLCQNFLPGGKFITRMPSSKGFLTLTELRHSDKNNTRGKIGLKRR